MTKYKLMEEATGEGLVYVEIRKGMYGLLQAGLVAQELMEQWLARNGYTRSKLIPGLWKHHTRPIQICLVADDFGMKYIRQEHAEYLYQILVETNKIITDWGWG